jgi:MoaA/NifB/PqqE/SkfB family radical SAM enzyme
MGIAYDYLVFNLTNRCNTFCKYCFQEANSNSEDVLTFKVIKEIIDFSLSQSKSARRIIHLTGGEPTLHRDFFKVVEYALQKDYILRIQTNGLTINTFSEDELALLSNPQVSLKVTIDGWSEKQHEYLRQQGTFNRILSNLEILTRVNPMVGIKTCVHKENISELHKILDFCLAHNVKGFSYNIIRDEGYANHILDKRAYAIEEIQVAQTLIPYFNKEKYQKLLNGNNLLLYYFCNGDIKYQPHFYINYDGKIYPHQSCVPVELIGDIMCGDLEQAFNAVLAETYCHSQKVDKETAQYVKEHLRIIS